MRTNIFKEDIYLPEAVGKQPKYWVEGYGKKFLFKYSTYKQDGTPIYNDVSECMAADIANLIGIPVAQYALCNNEGHNGVVTIDFLDNALDGPKKEEFFDGVHLIHQIDPGFRNTSLINPKTNQFYTVDLVLRSVSEYGLQKDAINMMVYDALIGNRDRNPSNYGIIINHENHSVRFSPLYDNCASLGISMVDHRLEKCIDSFGMVVDDEHLNLVVHQHIVGKVTLERLLKYKEKREWDKKEIDRIVGLIEEKKKEIEPLVEEGKMTSDYYHKTLYKIGEQYIKYDIAKLNYQTLIMYLTNYYSDEIADIMASIKENITEEKINEIFDYYKDELPIDRLNMAKSIVLKRGQWMTEHYYETLKDIEGKLL